VRHRGEEKSSQEKEEVRFFHALQMGTGSN
jgi:hypothetical protein